MAGELQLLALVLQLVQAVIDAALFHQLGVRTHLAHLAVVQDDNPVGVADGRQPVRDQQTGPVAHDFIQSVLDQRFGFSVDAGSRLVHHQNFRAENQHPRQRQELALADGKIAATFAHLGKIAVGQLANELIGVGVAGRLFDALLGDRRIAQDQVAAHVAGKQKHILQHHADMAAQGV